MTLTPVQVASWVMEDSNAPGRPGSGEKLYVLSVETGGGLAACAWTAATEPPGPDWCPVTWRREWDDPRSFTGSTGGGMRALCADLGAAISCALAKRERALRRLAGVSVPAEVEALAEKDGTP